MTGAELIAEKVRTNREHKGYTAKHDDEHTHSELIQAAVCYLHEAERVYDLGDTPPIWPFEVESWKPNDDPIRNLVHAGALIAAEIERLQRTREGRQLRKETKCENCGGSGKVHSHNDLCWECDGKGTV